MAQEQVEGLRLAISCDYHGELLVRAPVSHEHMFTTRRFSSAVTGAESLVAWL